MRLARFRRLLAAAAVAVGTAGLSPLGTRAAAPDLTFVTATTYEVHPAEGRIAVTVRITAANHLKDTVTRRFEFQVE